MIVVVDMDGTLCDSAHREHLARAKEWDKFHFNLKHDKVHSDVKLLLDTFANLEEGPDIVGLTGRNAKYRPATLDWLYKQGIQLECLLMRPDDNYEPDHELKPRMLAEYLQLFGKAPSDVWFILDDRDKVVEAWRNAGYNCWQPRSGGY